MASEQTFSDWYFAYCQANNCTPSMEEVWRAALATQPAESKACASVGVEPDDEPDAADEWRRLALQFDGHRMQALALIRQCIAKLAPHGLYDDLRESLITFNAAPPLSGEKVLADRIAALASPAPSVGEPVAQWQTSASGEGGWMNIDADEVEFCRDKRGYKVRALVLATPPAAPAATEAPSEPFAYYIHIAAEQRGEFVHDLDEALDDLTNCECKITELFDHAAPAPAVGASVQPVLASLSDAARDVLAERQRQIEGEGFSQERDDDYREWELSRAAICYADADDRLSNGQFEELWPWPMTWWKPRDARSGLVRSAALLLAELERLDRAALASSTPTSSQASEVKP